MLITAKRSSFSFTLLEILLVVSIVSVLASVVGWQIVKCVDRYFFQDEVEKFYLTLKEAQLLSLTYQTDIHMYLFQEGDAFAYQIETDEPFSAKELDKGKKRLKTVKKVTWQNRPIKKIDLFINARGAMQPHGILTFFCTREEESSPLWLDYQGAFLLTLSGKKPLERKEVEPALPRGL